MCFTPSVFAPLARFFVCSSLNYVANRLKAILVAKLIPFPSVRHSACIILLIQTEVFAKKLGNAMTFWLGSSDSVEVN